VQFEEARRGDEAPFSGFNCRNNRGRLSRRVDTDLWYEAQKYSFAIRSQLDRQSSLYILVLYCLSASTAESPNVIPVLLSTY